MREKIITALAFLGLIIISPILSIATDNDMGTNCTPVKKRYYDDRERGWFFKEYCEPVKPEEKKKAKAKTKKQAEPEIALDWDRLEDTAYLDSLDAPTFQKTFEAAKNDVVYHPTQDKMLTYLKLQDYMKNKSMNFAYLWRDVLLDHPELDATFKNPTSNYGAMAANTIKTHEKRQTMEKLREEIGLFFFVSGDCPYCHEEAKVLQLLVADYSIAIRTVSSDYCSSEFSSCSIEPDLFERLNVKVTPTLVAVYRDEKNNPKIQSVATGIVTEDDLVNRLVFYYKYFKTGKYPG